MKSPKGKAPKNSSRTGRSGFTLIEILIVLGIITAVIALGFPRIQKKSNNIKSVARQMVTLGKEIRNHARLTNSTFRLVIDFDAKTQKYWVEKARGVSYRENIDKDTFRKSDDEPPKTSFEIYKTLTKKEKELPSGLFFKSVEISGSEAQTQGLGFIYFSPEGFVESSAIQITDRKDINWTLIFNPLTGLADISTEALSLKEARP